MPFDGIISAVVGAGIAALAAFAWKRGRSWHLANALSKFWGPTKEKIGIIPVYDFEAKKGFSRAQDVLAIHELSLSLRGVGIECKINFDDRDVPDTIDLILVCSPKANKRSRKFYEDNENSLPFRIEYHEDGKSFDFHLGHTQPENAISKYQSPSNSGDVKEDIGLICRWKIDNRRIFLIWGVHGAGTLAAAHYISDRKSLKELVAATGDKDFCVIIKAGYTSYWEVDTPNGHGPIFFR
ncbi:MAG: hypothetical protein IID44_05795 [Planctomycetes bacterium]|nr:hypothetical protein [Planctomycetota bacterium]